jgi:hypothetical protein
VDIIAIALLWPITVLAASLINMLIWRAFTWSELVFDGLVGLLIGTCYVVGTGAQAGGWGHLFLVMSHGIPALLFLGGALSKGALLWTSIIMVLGCTTIAAALDRAALAIGKSMSLPGGLFSGLVHLFKLPFSLVTSGVGLLFVIVGIVRAATSQNCRIGFLAGQIYVEWDSSSDSTYATTIGFTVQVWRGQFERVIEHELYHSRQYIYLHDWLIPAWVLGGVWGLASSAVAGQPSLMCFQAAKPDREVGNPIERAPYRLSGPGLC